MLVDETGSQLNVSSANPSPGQRMGSLSIVRSVAYRAVTGAWDSRALLACSGGVDSTALVILAAEALHRDKTPPFVVAHVDHRTRPDSAGDADVVRGLCNRLNLPFVALTVAGKGSIPGRSDEDVWRERRYRELGRAARRLGLTTIVTAHTRDDQVETVLMRALSGSARLSMRRETSPDESGLSASLIRPLLDVPRSALEDVLEIAGVVPLHDPSNIDTRFRRNALRHDIVPLLNAVFPGFDRALLRSAALQEADGEFCDFEAARVFGSIVVLAEPDRVTLAKRALNELHTAIATRVVRLAVRSLIRDTDDRELTYERVMAVLTATGGRSGAVIELPYGVRVVVEHDDVRFSTVGR